MIKVLLVCLGNICRSPSAEGVLRQQIKERGLEQRISVDSAGTAAWHIGKSPDQRSIAAAQQRGIDISDLRARAVSPADFNDYDYILAMDLENLSNLKTMAPAECRAELSLFLAFDAQSSHSEVPDPYYGGEQGFNLVLDLVTDASEAFIKHVLKQHTL
ncbi:low molecular weight protein-tyrosine-phosphatase [Dasania marina]|uniref:low molecular weight protein-tyrosine-phosphatase n=1 Tax=Dasania marina TaxID=471499 RepID=UPI0030D91822|tara:strand:+ start:148381 stop:148857 length:477 start_codon:yes stop_codon:yes gene_type:complete